MQKSRLYTEWNMFFTTNYQPLMANLTTPWDEFKIGFVYMVL